MHETCRNNFHNGHSSKPANLIRFQLYILYLLYSQVYVPRRLNNAILRIWHDSIHCAVHIMCVWPDIRVNIKSSSVRYTCNTCMRRWIYWRFVFSRDFCRPPGLRWQAAQLSTPDSHAHSLVSCYNII